jgi:hypothetical protein
MHGATIDGLQHTWKVGNSFTAAGAAVRHTNMVSLATLVGSLMVIDGVFLQRASTVDQNPSKWKTVEITATIGQEIPYGYTALSSDFEASSDDVIDEIAPFGFTPPFSTVLNQYVVRSPINTKFSGCRGYCFGGNLTAAGLSYSCTNHTISWADYTSDENQTEFTLFDVSFSNLYRFKNDTSLSYSDRGTVDLQMELTYLGERYLGEGDTDMTTSTWSDVPFPPVVIKKCNITSATVAYPINLWNNIASFNDTIYQNTSGMAYPVISLQDGGTRLNTIGTRGPQSGSSAYMTLAGLATAANNLYHGGAYTTRNNQNEYTALGLMAELFRFKVESGQNRWRDPTNSVFDALNELMFRIAVRTAYFGTDINEYVNSGPTNITVLHHDGNQSHPRSYTLSYPAITPKFANATTQNITMQSFSVTVFKSRYEYLAAAVGIMLLSILVVVPTYNGFWELGREVTLSPIEIAKAFDAPLLRDGGSNATVRQLVRQVGNVKVAYGEAVDNEGPPGMQQGEVKKVLKFDLQERVTWPWAGSRYQ